MSRPSTTALRAFGRRIVERRAVLGLSQSDLARASGITAPIMCHYEAGRREPSYSNFRKLAMACECSMDWLAGVTDTVKSTEQASRLVLRAAHPAPTPAANAESAPHRSKGLADDIDAIIHLHGDTHADSGMPFAVWMAEHLTACGWVHPAQPTPKATEPV